MFVTYNKTFDINCMAHSNIYLTYFYLLYFPGHVFIFLLIVLRSYDLEIDEQNSLLLKKLKMPTFYLNMN